MDSFWIKLNTSEIKTFTINEPSVWEELITTFKIECKIVHPLSGVITISPQEKGCFVQGQLSGKVVTPCNRCATPVDIEIKHSFKNFEPIPTTAVYNEDCLNEEVDDFIVRVVNGVLEVNLAGILWEEFMLFLPIKPLCKTDCKGLCSCCGKDLNEGSCNCIESEGDPRFAALKNLTNKKCSFLDHTDS